MSSTMPEALVRLLANLQARPGLSNAAVSDGDPAAGITPAQYDRVYVEDPINIEREWRVLGQQRVDEAYVLPVAVETLVVGELSTKHAARVRLLSLVDEVEGTVRADLSLGGLIRKTDLEGMSDIVTEAFDEGWAARTVVRFRCEQRI